MTLPRGWAAAKIREIADVNPKHPSETKRNQIVSFVPMPAVDERLGAIIDAIDRPLEEVWKGYTHFADGDVIFAKITPCMENGKAAVASGLTNGLACGSTEFYVLRPEGKADARYLWRFIRQDSFRMAAEKRMSGAVGQRRVPRSYLEEFSLPLPPAAEQRRIVAKLDALTARIARARAELDRVPVLAARLRQNVLSFAQSGAFSDAKAVEYRPCSDWIESTFYGPRFGKEEYVEQGVPTARTTDFNADGSMSLADAPHVGCSDDEYKRWGLVDGDLLVTRTGSIGKCAIYRSDYGPVLPSAYLIRVRFAAAVLPRFAWMMFASPHGQNHLGVSVRAVTQPNINASAIRSFLFPALTTEQQRATIAAVDRLLSRADRLEAEAARARALLDRLESAILAKAFRGELVPQDASDEPASALLERVRAQRAASPARKRAGRRAGPC